MNGYQRSDSLHLGRLVKEYKKFPAQVAMVIILSLVSAAVAAVFFAV
jgi:hypothetical protein